tara:strand:+ start:20758 stop:21534 length:777 start_codon:yes stop_codon:yes gene_type:complete
MQKKNLVIIHGFLQSSEIFYKNQEIINILHSKYNLLIIDLPGYGKNHSIKFNNATKLNNYLDFIYIQIQSYFNNINSQDINILGWSLGGNIAILLAQKYPIINNLILLCSNPCFVINKTNNIGMEQSIFENFHNNLQNNYSKTINKFLKLQLLGIEKIKFKIYYDQLNELFNSNKKPNIETLLFNLDILNLDLRESLINLENKITYILSDNDYLVPYEIIKYLNIIKKPQDIIYTIENSSHIPHLTNTNNFLDILHML